MGTFTVSFWARKAIWEKKHLWFATGIAWYIGRCWDAAGMQKASMMKGHSKMFANRPLTVPQGADVWKW